MRASSVAWIGLLAVAVVGACGGRATARNLLVVTMDTTRADALGCYGAADAGTPCLDRLAAEGTRFARAYAPAPLTLPSHATLFTGTYPTYHGIHYNGTHTLADSAVTLAEVLAGGGFRCAAAVGAYVLHSQFGLAQGFGEYDEGFDPAVAGGAERPASAVTDDGIDFLARVGGERFFLWVHYYDPHEPYAPPPPFDARWTGHPYQGEVAYMDQEIGRLLDALELEGHAEDTLVVAVADHGEGLAERGELPGHGMLLGEETMRVPLLLRFPPAVARGAVVERVVGVVDVMPTVLELLDVRDAEAPLQGRSLLASSPGRALYLETHGPRALFGWDEILGVVRGRWKYVVAAPPELYDLEADPEEATNLCDARPDEVRALRGELERLLRETSRTGAAGEIAADEETRRRLESLGYLASAGGDGPGAGRADPERADTSAMVALAQAVEAASRLEATNPGAALAAYRRILREHPDNAAAHAGLGQLLIHQGDPRGAVEHLERAIAARGEAVQTYRLLAFAQLQVGDLDAAQAAVRASLAIHPRSNQSLFLESLVLDAKGELPAAVDAAERALAIDPSYQVARLHLGRLLARSGRREAALAQLDAIPPESSARYGALEAMATLYAAAGRAPELARTREELTRLRAAGARPAPVITIAGGGY